MSELGVRIPPGMGVPDRIRGAWSEIERLAGKNLQGYSPGDELTFSLLGRDNRRHAWRVTRMLVLGDVLEEYSCPAVIMGSNGNAYYLDTDDMVRCYSPQRRTVDEAGLDAHESMASAAALALDALRLRFDHPLPAPEQ